MDGVKNCRQVRRIGIVCPSDPVQLLRDKDGMPDMKVLYSTVTNYSSSEPFDDSYEISKSSIVRTVFRDNITIKGNWFFLYMGVVTLILYAVDRKWPLLFFRLKHSMHVYSPEPSDFYLSMQKFSWKVLPIVAIGFFIAGLHVMF